MNGITLLIIRGNSNLVIVSRTDAWSIARHFTGASLYANIIEGDKTPNLSVQKFEDTGYKLAAFVLSGLF